VGSMKYIWLLYLQILFFAGQFNRRKNWIDKHIIICYNKLNELEVNYNKIHNLDEK
jgi:recombinational DNA repair ATPase RecF